MNDRAVPLEERVRQLSPTKRKFLAQRLKELGAPPEEKRSGVGGRRLIAYVLCYDRSLRSADRLRDAIMAELPQYMMPSDFVFVDSLPRTPNGKIDREALPRPEIARARPQLLVGPRNDVESAVCAIWQQVLGVDRISIHDDFFELGGHSLVAAQIQYSIKDIFQVDLSIRDLFESTTVAKLSATIIANETRPGRTERIARAMKLVGSLSEADVIERLEKRGRGDIQ
jgi:acyl carrier protein